MPLSDFEIAKEEFAKITDGEYLATIDDCSGDIGDGKIRLKVRYRLVDGEFKGRVLFKDYYFSEKTVAKFLPWQFGVIGIWEAVRDADDFEKGLQVAIDEMGNLMKNNTQLLLKVENEKYVWDGQQRERLNVIVSQNISGIPESVSTSDNGFSPTINENEDVPF